MRKGMRKVCAGLLACVLILALSCGFCEEVDGPLTREQWEAMTQEEKEAYGQAVYGGGEETLSLEESVAQVLGSLDSLEEYSDFAEAMLCAGNIVYGDTVEENMQHLASLGFEFEGYTIYGTPLNRKGSHFQAKTVSLFLEGRLEFSPNVSLLLRTEAQEYPLVEEEKSEMPMEEGDSALFEDSGNETLRVFSLGEEVSDGPVIMAMLEYSVEGGTSFRVALVPETLYEAESYRDMYWIDQYASESDEDILRLLEE